jgi:hypothetical protein
MNPRNYKLHSQPMIHPGQFPLCSPGSRAAAQALIAERRESTKLVDMILRVAPSEQPYFHEWASMREGTYTRRSRIPDGMTFEDAERIAGVPPIHPKGEYIRFWIDDTIRTAPSDATVQPEF